MSRERVGLEAIKKLADEAVKFAALDDEFRKKDGFAQEIIIRETTAAMVGAMTHWRTNSGSLMRGLLQAELDDIKELIHRDDISYYLYEGPKFKI